MKKVVHISNTDVRTDARIHKEINSLSVLTGVEIVAIGVPDSDGPGRSQTDLAHYIIFGLWMRAFQFLPRSIRYSLEMLEFTAKAVWAAWRQKPDVIHCHDTFALPAGWLVKTLTRCKLVYDAHELESDKNGQSGTLSKATLAIERFCWRKIDLLISVSDSILEWYQQNLGAKDSILVLNSPIISQAATTIRTGGKQDCLLREAFAIPDNALIFVYVGIYGHGRGVEAILESFSASAVSAHVVFVGYGPLDEMIAEYAARYPNIHKHDPVPHDHVVSTIQGANYGLCFIENVSLSDYYCLPNKLFEYVFSGLRVVASNFPEIDAMINKYAIGFTCEPTAAGIQQAILSAQGNSLDPQEHDLYEVSWEHQAERLRAAYRRLLN